MRMTVLFLVLIGFFYSCSTIKKVNNDSLIGDFYSVSEGYVKNTYTQYSLKLDTNYEFKFIIKGHDYSPQCSGIWKLNGDTITLNCADTETIAEKLSSGYMNQREFKVKVLNKNKLQLGKVILKRK